MHLLYMNPSLTHFGSAPGTWGRQVVRELREVGAEVSTMPAIPEENGTGNGSGGPMGPVKRFVKERLPIRIGSLLIEYYMLARGLMRTMLWSWRVWRRRHQLDPDVVLGRTLEYEWTPWIVANILKRPLMLEVHSPFYMERRMRGRGNSPILRWLECAQWRRAERIWVNSRELESIIAGNGIARERIRFIPFGVRLEKFPERTPRPNNRPVQIVFVGSFFEWHGIEELLRAFAIARKQTANIHLRLVGDGVVRPSSEKLAQSLGIGDSVEFTGWVSPEEVVEHLKQADIGAAPFLKLEQFYFDPAKILEYMAAGLAIVSTEQGRIGEMVQHRENGLLVPPGAVEPLAEALVELAEDRELRERLGKAARTKLAREYTWEISAKRVLGLAEEAAASADAA